jgi:putative phosphoesterase
MKRIGLISDTHTFINPKLYDFFKDVDEIWHAGDIGNIETLNKLKEFKTVKAVYGNIDGQDIRVECPKFNVFSCEDVKVFLTHIGGYPNRYAPGIKDLLIKHKPKLFICGHSHILKVINDKKLNLLHMNPGAAGNSGLHKHITMLRFIIDGKNIKDLEVFELMRN